MWYSVPSAMVLGSGRAPVKPADTAERLRDAAFELFSAQGFDATTVDDIAQRADVGRTTFFRHFRAKEDVVFPDHPGLSAAVADRLEALRGEQPVRAVTEGALLVLDRYLVEGDRARARYRLVTSVEALRARELASVHPYQRAFGRYLRGVLPAGLHGHLYADVVAAAVIAAHNNVLRRWLREESDDPRSELRDVLAEVFDRWAAPVEPGRSSLGRPSGSTVVVLDSGLPPTDAARAVADALARRGTTTEEQV